MPSYSQYLAICSYFVFYSGTDVPRRAKNRTFSVYYFRSLQPFGYFEQTLWSTWTVCHLAYKKECVFSNKCYQLYEKLNQRNPAAIN